ncbi:MAG: hypothetical protein H0V17_24675 [Deltaproteobacteria bacterium]|nr:hypothetical protein [Deltaproteobacteria bacterium]
MVTPIRILGFALVVAAVIAVCLLWMPGAMAIGGITLIAVGLDGLRPRGTQLARIDQTLSVDLSRRW